MQPISFPQANRIYAKDQREFLALPAYSDARETISCWRLTWWERVLVLFRGRLWWRQLNFGKPLQAQSPSIQSPFLTKAELSSLPTSIEVSAESYNEIREQLRDGHMI